jgi:hypothetical protein
VLKRETSLSIVQTFHERQGRELAIVKSTVIFVPRRSISPHITETSFLSQMISHRVVHRRIARHGDVKMGERSSRPAGRTKQCPAVRAQSGIYAKVRGQALGIDPCGEVRSPSDPIRGGLTVQLSPVTVFLVLWLSVGATLCGRPRRGRHRGLPLSGRPQLQVDVI